MTGLASQGPNWWGQDASLSVQRPSSGLLLLWRSSLSGKHFMFLFLFYLSSGSGEATLICLVIVSIDRKQAAYL